MQERRRWNAGRKRSGFTLFELLIVMAVISLVAGMAVPLYFERGEVTLENAAIQMAHDLRSAQNRAAFLGRSTSVEFLPEGAGYELTLVTGEPLPGPYGTKRYRRVYSRDGVFEGVRVLDVELDVPGHAVSF